MPQSHQRYVCPCTHHRCCPHRGDGGCGFLFSVTTMASLSYTASPVLMTISRNVWNRLDVVVVVAPIIAPGCLCSVLRLSAPVGGGLMWSDASRAYQLELSLRRRCVRLSYGFGGESIYGMRWSPLPLILIPCGRPVGLSVCYEFPRAQGLPALLARWSA